MSAWIVYDEATLKGIRYRTGGAVEPTFDPATEAVLQVPEPATANRVVKVDGKITFKSQPDIRPARPVLTREQSLELVDDALDGWAAGDRAKLRKILAGLVGVRR